MTLQDTHKKLRKRRLQNILLNFLCILIAGSGLIWVANYFWKYIHYEIMKLRTTPLLTST